MPHPATTSSPPAHAGHKPWPFMPKTIFWPPPGGRRTTRWHCSTGSRASTQAPTSGACSTSYKTTNPASTPGRHATCWPRPPTRSPKEPRPSSTRTGWPTTSPRKAIISLAASCCSHSSTPRSPQRGRAPPTFTKSASCSCTVARAPSATPSACSWPPCACGRTNTPRPVSGASSPPGKTSPPSNWATAAFSTA